MLQSQIVHCSQPTVRQAQKMNLGFKQQSLPSHRPPGAAKLWAAVRSGKIPLVMYWSVSHQEAVLGCLLSFEVTTQWQPICIGDGITFELGPINRGLSCSLVLWNIVNCCHSEMELFFLESGGGGAYEKKQWFFLETVYLSTGTRKLNPTSVELVYSLQTLPQEPVSGDPRVLTSAQHQPTNVDGNVLLRFCGRCRIKIYF